MSKRSKSRCLCVTGELATNASILNTLETFLWGLEGAIGSLTPLLRAFSQALLPRSFRFTPNGCAGGGVRRLKHSGNFLKPCGADFMDIAFGPCIEGLSAHQSREHIAGCGRASARVDCPRAVARVSAGFRARDTRRAEDWESLHARPCQTRRAALFRSPCCMPQLNMESTPDCHVAPSRIPRSMIGVDENLCAHSLLGACIENFSPE